MKPILSIAVLILSVSQAIAYEVVRSYEGSNNRTHVLQCTDGTQKRIYEMHDNPRNPYGGYRSQAEEARRVCGETSSQTSIKLESSESGCYEYFVDSSRFSKIDQSVSQLLNNSSVRLALQTADKIGREHEMDVGYSREGWSSYKSKNYSNRKEFCYQTGVCYVDGPKYGPIKTVWIERVIDKKYSFRSVSEEYGREFSVPTTDCRESNANSGTCYWSGEATSMKLFSVDNLYFTLRMRTRGFKTSTGHKRTAVQYRIENVTRDVERQDFCLRR